MEMFYIWALVEPTGKYISGAFYGTDLENSAKQLAEKRGFKFEDISTYHGFDLNYRDGYIPENPEYMGG
jgi:RecB family endonuclease NucS